MKPIACILAFVIGLHALSWWWLALDVPLLYSGAVTGLHAEIGEFRRMSETEFASAWSSIREGFARNVLHASVCLAAGVLVYALP